MLDMIKPEFVENPSLLQEKCKFFMYIYINIISYLLGLSLLLKFLMLQFLIIYFKFL